MNIFSALKSPSKILAALALPLLAGFALHASAGDIPASDPTAPCGVLKQIGKNAAIYNKSNFTFKVRFEAEAVKSFIFPTVNAAAIKYLDYDENNQGIWKDTGEGDYRSVKKYTVPVSPDSVTQIAYCVDTRNQELIKGKFYFESDPSEGEHNMPNSGVDFYTSGKVVVLYSSHLFTPYLTPFVRYNVEAGLGSRENGSMVICPKDRFCKMP